MTFIVSLMIALVGGFFLTQHDQDYGLPFTWYGFALNTLIALAFLLIAVKAARMVFRTERRRRKERAITDSLIRKLARKE